MRCEVFGRRGRCRRIAMVVIESPKRREFGLSSIACCWQHVAAFVDGADSVRWDPVDWDRAHPVVDVGCQRGR